MGFLDYTPFGAVTNLLGGDDSSGDIKKAAKTAAEAQIEALEYLKEREEIPQYFREAALKQLGSIYGISMPTAPPSVPSATAAQTNAPFSGEVLNILRYLGADVPDYGAEDVTPTRWQPPTKRTVETEPSKTPFGDIMKAIGAQTEGQAGLILRAVTSPLYRSIMGGQEAGEEAILRNVSATGGLRSGNVQEALYDYNTQLQNQALLQAYNEQLTGLKGLAGLPSEASEIAQLITDIGTTKAQGITGAAQAEQVSQQIMWQNLLGLGQIGLGAAFMFSDRRLKKNIKRIGTVKGWPWYEWTWNIVANKMGMKGKCQGIMADEVFKTRPDAVFLKDFFMMVNYSALGILP